MAHESKNLKDLCSEFKLENIYSRVNFCEKNVCDNFYLGELIFADRWRNRKNCENKNPQKFRATRYFQCVRGLLTSTLFACSRQEMKNRTILLSTEEAVLILFLVTKKNNMNLQFVVFGVCQCGTHRVPYFRQRNFFLECPVHLEKTIR